MDSKRIQDLEMVQKILKVLGLLHKKSSIQRKYLGIFFKLHPYVVFMPFTILFTALLWLEVLHGEKLNSFLASFNLAITFTACSLKLLDILKQRDLIEPLLTEWRESPYCELHSTGEHFMWRTAQNRFRKVAFGFIFTCSSIFVPLAFVPISTGFTSLPIKFFHPFDISDTRTFLLLHCYEMMCLFITAIAISAIDIFNCGLLLHVALFIELTSHRLQNLRIEDSDEEFYEKLINIMKFHEYNTKRYFKVTESILSTSILSVISSSSFMMCSNTYLLQQLSILKNPSASLYNIQFIFGAMAQIFLPCYYGNMILYNSQGLSTNIYCSHWNGRSKRIRRTIIIFMLSVNKPMILRAGNFFTIEIQTFSKVMRAAYQLLAVLANMNN